MAYNAEKTELAYNHGRGQQPCKLVHQKMPTPSPLQRCGPPMTRNLTCDLISMEGGGFDDDDDINLPLHSLPSPSDVERIFDACGPPVTRNLTCELMAMEGGGFDDDDTTKLHSLPSPSAVERVERIFHAASHTCSAASCAIEGLTGYMAGNDLLPTKVPSVRHG
jgi:hypothetical protein